MITKTKFHGYEFNDRYRNLCSLQNSSLAGENAVWFGVNEPDTAGNTRMHLTQEMVQNLLPLLLHFAETGELP